MIDPTVLRSAAVKQAMRDGVTLRAWCRMEHTGPDGLPTGPAAIVATIGGGFPELPAGARVVLDPRHQLDGSHQPRIMYHGRQIR